LPYNLATLVEFETYFSRKSQFRGSKSQGSGFDFFQCRVFVLQKLSKRRPVFHTTRPVDAGREDFFSLRVRHSSGVASSLSRSCGRLCGCDFPPKTRAQSVSFAASIRARRLANYAPGMVREAQANSSGDLIGCFFARRRRFLFIVIVRHAVAIVALAVRRFESRLSRRTPSVSSLMSWRRAFRRRPAGCGHACLTYFFHTKPIGNRALPGAPGYVNTQRELRSTACDSSLAHPAPSNKR